MNCWNKRETNWGTCFSMKDEIKFHVHDVCYYVNALNFKYESPQYSILPGLNAKLIIENIGLLYFRYSLYIDCSSDMVDKQLVCEAGILDNRDGRSIYARSRRECFSFEPAKNNICLTHDNISLDMLNERSNKNESITFILWVTVLAEQNYGNWLQMDGNFRHKDALAFQRHFLFNKEWSDVIIKCPDASSEDVLEEIPAHKLFLVARSEYFRTMFASPMKEASTNVVTISNFNSTIMNEVVRCIYLNEVCRDVVEENAEVLSEAADMFQLEELKALCQIIINENANSV